MDENITNLKSFINKRIKLNFEDHGINYDANDPWSTLIPDDDYAYGGKSSFKFIIDFTFYRPRDLILYLSRVGLKEYTFPMQPETVKLLLKKYIESNIAEIKNELGLNFTSNEIRILFEEVFPYIIKHPHTTRTKLCEYLKNFEFDQDSNEVFRHLREYSLIAFKDSQGKLFFEYRGEQVSENESNTLLITLPKCIYNNYVDIN